MNLKHVLVQDEESLSTLKAFLQKNNLPSDDIRLEGNRFFIYRDGQELVGSGGLEFHGNYCLLRSIAVAPEFRNKKIGETIVNDLKSKAKDAGASNIYLLTETAPLFFEKLGFQKQERSNAPVEIRSSSEFSSVCPVSAVMMNLRLV